MQIELVEMIRKEYEEYPEAFGGPVPEIEIIEAEKELRVHLLGDYKEFIKLFGAGAVGKTVVLGLRECQFIATPSFVVQSNRFRGELPAEYKEIVVIGVDGAGNPVGFVPPDRARVVDGTAGQACEGAVFVTPALIVHYIEVHAYQPPDQFIAAINLVTGCESRKS